MDWKTFHTELLLLLSFPSLVSCKRKAQERRGGKKRCEWVKELKREGEERRQCPGVLLSFIQRNRVSVRTSAECNKDTVPHQVDPRISNAFLMGRVWRHKVRNNVPLSFRRGSHGHTIWVPFSGMRMVRFRASSLVGRSHSFGLQSSQVLVQNSFEQNLWWHLKCDKRRERSPSFL